LHHTVYFTGALMHILQSRWTETVLFVILKANIYYMQKREKLPLGF